jgi:hypothetical protein
VELKWDIDFVNSTRPDRESLVLYLWDTDSYPPNLRDYYPEPSDSTYEVGSLRPGAVYTWHIEAAAAMYQDHREVYARYASDEWTFTTADTLWEFGRMENPTPDSGAVDVDTIVTLSCDVYNPYGVDFEYDFYLDTSAVPRRVATGLDAPSYGPDTLLANTIYYWRVVAYNDTDMVEGPLWRFSTVYGGSDEIFAMLQIDALQAPSGYHTDEYLRVRLDDNYAPTSPDIVLEADSVYINDFKLPWDNPSSSYYWWEMSMPMITNGGQVNLLVYSDGDLPQLDVDFTFPACTLAILSPEGLTSVPISGFEVTWDHSDGDGGGTVWLVLMDGADSTGVRKLVPNDGSDSLTAADLTPLGGVTGTYDLYIIRQVEENIIAPGYLPLSFVRFRAMNRMPQISITSSK